MNATYHTIDRSREIVYKVNKMYRAILAQLSLRQPKPLAVKTLDIHNVHLIQQHRGTTATHREKLTTSSYLRYLPGLFLYTL
jgi:benzoyl-CoA reductase/2-hydroxyglutaryl-CoA dehydratase subunit BcrC/BadD/HgdB